MPLTRPLTRPLTQKVIRPDLTQGFGGKFSPYALDPYLLFDARESMVGTLENPTLDLNPALPETLDVITATRAGVATYTDADGVIQSADPDTVRVDHVQGEELTPTVYQRVGYTDFSSGWNSLGATTQAGNGYLGQPSLIVNAPVVNARTTTLVPTETGVSYTASFYVRYVSGSSGLVWMYTQFASDNQFTPITVTSEWTRVQVQFTGGSGSAVNFGVSPKIAGESVEIAMPQVEEGTTASDFVANTTGSPKFITGATYGPRVPMILVEPSATNLVESSDINSSWAFYYNDSNITQHTNDLGGVNAYVLSRIGSNQKTSLQHGFISGASTPNATASLFYKNIGEARFFQFWDTNLSNTRHVNVDTLTDDVFESDGSASITVLGNGWRRLEWTRPSNTVHNGGYMRLSLADSLGDSRNPNFSGTGGIAFAGFQLEEGDLATSFIPTSGSTVTRAADDLVISGSDFTDFYNATEGTFYVESKTKTDTNYIFQASSSAGNPYNNRHLAFNTSVNRISVYSATGGAAQYSQVSLAAVSINELSRIAYSYKQGDFRVSFNGEAEPTPTGNQVPSSTIDQIHLGDSHDGSYPLNGHIKRLIYWPYHSDSL